MGGCRSGGPLRGVCLYLMYALGAVGVWAAVGVLHEVCFNAHVWFRTLAGKMWWVGAAARSANGHRGLHTHLPGASNQSWGDVMHCKRIFGCCDNFCQFASLNTGCEVGLAHADIMVARQPSNAPAPGAWLFADWLELSCC